VRDHMLAKSAHGVRRRPWPGMISWCESAGVRPEPAALVSAVGISSAVRPEVFATAPAGDGHGSDGLMQWSLPALGTTGLVAGYFDVTAAGGCCRFALARSPGDEDRARLPLMAKTALLGEARPHPPSWLLHVTHSNISSYSWQAASSMRSSARLTGPGCHGRW
jgi:hypothetical protein